MKIVPGISKPVVVTYSTQGMSIDAGTVAVIDLRPLEIKAELK